MNGTLNRHAAFAYHGIGAKRTSTAAAPAIIAVLSTRMLSNGSPSFARGHKRAYHRKGCPS